ncbi:hypothetical protein CPC08DRAFT_132988 [Agrocybe pediades]|nr:hypothetical protein CPC08DRAFT_132988 [Agrocybe pediades]
MRPLNAHTNPLSRVHFASSCVLPFECAIDCIGTLFGKSCYPCEYRFGRHPKGGQRIFRELCGLDAFSRETFDSIKNGSELDASTLQSLSTKIPMFEVALGVCEAAKMHHKRGEEEQLSAAYHCFSDLARSLADRFNSTKYNYFGQTRRYEGWHVFRHFEAIIGHDPDRRLPLFDYLTLPYYGMFDAATVPQENQERSNLLYHEFIAMFLDGVPHPKFRVHLAEVLIRVMTCVYGPGKKHDLLPTSVLLKPGDEPLCMSMHALETEVTRTIPKSGILHIDSAEFQMLLQQYANVFRKFFECAGSIWDMEDKSPYMVVHTGVHIPEFMWSAYTLFSDTSYRELLLKDVKGAENAFTAIIDTIQNQLDTFLIEHPSSANDQASNLNVLFYTATLFVRRLHTIGVHEDSLIKGHIREKINDIIPTLAMYKRKILDVHGPAAVLEERYGGTDRRIPRFTQEWWEFLDSRSSDYGHH